MNPLRIVSHGTVVASQLGTERQSCCFAGVCGLLNGRWLVSFRAARTKTSTLHQTFVTWSDDEDNIWSAPVRFRKTRIATIPCDKPLTLRFELSRAEIFGSEWAAA